MKHTMLHMKLNSAVSVFAVTAVFSIFLPSSNAFAGICFLPDCMEDGLNGIPDMNINEDTVFCESKGYTYYASGKCPDYYAKVGECSRDDHYLECDAKTWCKNNEYNTTSCSIPQYVDTPCPSDGSLYKQCKTDNARACKDTGYTNSCSSGQKLKKTSGRCSYDSSYGTCCTPSGCPSYTSLTSSSYGTNGTDGCEYTCYYTCNINCPSSYPYSSDPTGCSSSTKNGCGNKTCYNYESCCTPSCSDSSGCSCGTYTISDGCGGTCIRCSTCCTHSSHQTCEYGCATTCPCCSSCKTCNSATGVKSCTTKFNYVTNTKPHCQNWYEETNAQSKFTLNCGMNITSTLTRYNGTVDEYTGTTYNQRKTFASGTEATDKANCEAARESYTCYDDGYRYPYCCTSSCKGF